MDGFDAKVSSTVLPGSGLSSSAAFEVLIGRILNGLFAGGEVSAIEIAQIGQYAENEYFGKPCGLMDQMASSVGGMVFIDFADPKNPIVEKVNYDFTNSGYTLCTIDSGADHADLTEEYSAIPSEMKQVAAFLDMVPCVRSAKKTSTQELRKSEAKWVTGLFCGQSTSSMKTAGFSFKFRH